MKVLPTIHSFYWIHVYISQLDLGMPSLLNMSKNFFFFFFQFSGKV